MMKTLLSKIETLINDYIKNNGVTLGHEVNEIQLTENFKLSEFNCKCNGRTAADCGNAVKVHPELIRRLQKIRDEAGAPVNISSAFRCPNHNKRVGGSENSYHMRGMAADFTIKGKSIAYTRQLAEKYFPDGGVGYYSTFTHVDVRGVKTRWNG
jgi:uncharacterized protein YcbK (DUF882 family)